MSSWWWWGFRILSFRVVRYQPSLTPSKFNMETWKCLEKEEHLTQTTSFFGFQPLVLGCVYVRSQGKIFSSINTVAAWQRYHFLRRRYHSSSHAWRRKLRTFFISFLRLEDPPGEMFEVGPLFHFFFDISRVKWLALRDFVCLFVFFVNKEADSMVMNDFL